MTVTYESFINECREISLNNLGEDLINSRLGCNEETLIKENISETKWKELVLSVIFEKAKQEQQIFVFEQNEFAAIESAQIDGVYGDSKFSKLEDSYYVANGFDKKGQHVQIIWDIIVENPESETDESNMCDWDHPSNVIFV